MRRPRPSASGRRTTARPSVVAGVVHLEVRSLLRKEALKGSELGESEQLVLPHWTRLNDSKCNAWGGALMAAGGSSLRPRH